MFNETLIQLVEQYGYLIFFLAFSLGPFGIPVPNEVTIVSGSMMTNNGLLNPWITYFCILIGLITAVTLGFYIGKVFGKRVVGILRNKGHRHLMKAEKLFNTYGDIAMCLAFFIPVVRYVVPVLVGMNGVRFKKFALLSYSSAIAWTGIFLGIGKTFGVQLLQLPSLIDLKTVVLIVTPLIIVFVLTKLIKLPEIMLLKRIQKSK